MILDIQPLDPASASERVLSDYFAMRAACVAADTPEDPPLTYETSIGRLRTPPLEDGLCRFWVGYVDGRLAGSVKLALPEGENSGIASIEVNVHPELRCRGIGTDLLRFVMPAVKETQRATVLGFPVKPGSAGARRAEHLGFDVTHSMSMQVLVIATAPETLWDVPVPSGYRLVHWTGAAPDHLVDSYALARQAIHDAPMGQLSYRETVWTSERVRVTDRELLDAGTEQRVVVAIDEATGQVVATHVIHNYPHRREIGYVHDTSVLAAHRGHGLGRAIKAALMRRLNDERPDLERICTTTATTNSHMIGINRALGYHTARTLDWIETTTERLTEELAAAPSMG
ncbi:GNAT family N-acetyltransferase [Kitasatospora sp. GAS204B]|uniref:GNAT family N-acetyltransferase n=1 Tax=unclassified Kitasatospora TaxID=2633591 RepID=UPI0024736E31|nr:GNAT family N-acetyltransferase [Kitasatospora sp. GAS204B]MDH6118944.1 mycothiol synthase [Kitasatospora sp. GAS204B]